MKAPVLELPEEGLHLKRVIAMFERDILVQALRRTNWKKKEAAKLLGIDFRSMRYRCNKYKLVK